MSDLKHVSVTSAFQRDAVSRIADAMGDVDLSIDEIEFIRWFAGFDNFAVINLCSILLKVRLSQARKDLNI